MILGKMFPEDSREIARIQHELYRQSIRAMFFSAKEKYISAELTLEIRTELGKELRKADSLDHRSLQWLHDAIAGKFRLNYLTTHSDDQSNLFRLPSSDLSLEVDCKWNQFLITELEAIFLETPSMIKHICMATVFHNPDERGCLAEDSIYRYTLIRYEDLLAKKPTQLGLL